MVSIQPLSSADPENKIPAPSEGSASQQKATDPKKAEQDAALEEHFNLIEGCPVFRPTIEEFSKKSFS